MICGVFYMQKEISQIVHVLLLLPKLNAL